MLDIQEATRTGKSGRAYKQFYVDGKLVGCDCDQARAITIEKYGFKPCAHMTGRKVLVLPVVEQSARVAVSCEMCGRWTYKPDGVCGTCYGY